MIYEFQATQDLHGYDSPWPAGGGKNLAHLYDADLGHGSLVKDKTDNSVTVYNQTENAAYKYAGYKVLDMADFAGQTLACSAKAETIIGSSLPRIVGAFYTENGKVGSNLFEKVGNSMTAIITVPADLPEGAWLQFTMYSSSNNAGIHEIRYYDIQVEKGSTATSFAPYANVCMPEGFNIWDPGDAEYFQVYAGYVNANTRELYLRPVYQEYAGEELVGPWMSSLDPYDEDTTPTEGAFVIDFGGELTSYEITPFMLQTLLDSLGIRQHFTDGAGLLNKLMDQAQGRVRSEEELIHLSRPLNVIAIGDQLPAGLTFKPISKDVLPGLPGKFIR